MSRRRPARAEGDRQHEARQERARGHRNRAKVETKRAGRWRKGGDR